MKLEDKELVNKIWDLAEKYAGLKQFTNDTLNRLGSYQEDIKRHKERSEEKHDLILREIQELRKDSQKQIERLVEGMNEKHKRHEQDITEIKTDIVKAKASWKTAGLIAGGISSAAITIWNMTMGK